MRWDILTAGYLFGMGAVVFAFGMNNTPEFNVYVLAGANGHFAFETVLSWYLLYPPHIAKWMAVAIWIVHLTSAILQMAVLTYDQGRIIFGILVFISDGSALFMPAFAMTAPDVHPAIQRLAMIVALHQAGFLITLCNNSIRLYTEALAPSIGAGWLVMGVVAVVQLYLLRPYLRRRFNHIAAPKQTGHGAWLAPMGIVILIVTNSLLLVFRTTPTNAASRLYAVGFWPDVIWFVGAPLSLGVSVVTCFYLAMKDWGDLDGLGPSNHGWDAAPHKLEMTQVAVQNGNAEADA